MEVGVSREALLRSFALVFGLILFMGADYASSNFIIKNAPDARMAKEFGDTAEKCRKELAVFWLGNEMPEWSAKCPITVKVGDNLNAGGATSFRFKDGHVYDWVMDIQGSRERILDSVLPHEITHMIFASYFRRPVPRWIDEGGATFVEHESEKANYRKMLLHFLRDDIKRGIPFNKMVAMKEYPGDVMPLYAQGFSVAELLIGLGGPHKFIAFAETGMKTGNWGETVNQYYGFEDLNVLQTEWIQWVSEGSPDPVSPLKGDIVLASATLEPISSPILPKLGRSSLDKSEAPVTAFDIPPYTAEQYNVSSSSSKAVSNSEKTDTKVILEWSRFNSGNTLE